MDDQILFLLISIGVIILYILLAFGVSKIIKKLMILFYVIFQNGVEEQVI